MSNWYPSDPEMYEDVQTRWQYFNVGTKRSPEKRLQRLWYGSRDSARTPVQWSAEENAGFTTGKPWFYVNENYVDVNVADQEKDENSVLNFYRKAIRLRKELSCVKDGKYSEYCTGSSSVYVYARENDGQKILVICSYTEKEVPFRGLKGFNFASAQLILHNYDEAGDTLKPYETRVYLWNK